MINLKTQSTSNKSKNQKFIIPEWEEFVKTILSTASVTPSLFCNYHRNNNWGNNKRVCWKI